MFDVTAGGEAARVTNISTGARAPQFSPDGSHLLFVSTVYRGAMTDQDNKRLAEERKVRKYDARVYDTFPIRNWDQWVEPERQPHVLVQALEPGAEAKDLLELFLEEDFGNNWGQWQGRMQQWLQDNPD